MRAVPCRLFAVRRPSLNGHAHRCVRVYAGCELPMDMTGYAVDTTSELNCAGQILEAQCHGLICATGYHYDNNNEKVIVDCPLADNLLTVMKDSFTLSNCVKGFASYFLCYCLIDSLNGQWVINAGLCRRDFFPRKKKVWVQARQTPQATILFCALLENK